MTIGQSIRKIRKDKKMTQGKLARKCGISQALLSHYETDRASPSLFNSITIADILEVSLDELVGRNFTKSH